MPCSMFQALLLHCAGTAASNVSEDLIMTLGAHIPTYLPTYLLTYLHLRTYVGTYIYTYVYRTDSKEGARREQCSPPAAKVPVKRMA